MKMFSRLRDLAKKLLRILRSGARPPAVPQSARSVSQRPVPKQGPALSTERGPKGRPIPATAPHPARSEQPSRTVRNLIVGIDFGTSTTKVVWHDTTASTFEVFRWQTESAGIESALLPSRIALHDQEFWFGRKAADLPNADLSIPWIKICVLCEGNPAICRRCPHSPARGTVEIGRDGKASARVLAALFIAHVIGAVEGELQRRYAGEELRLQWNLGCPMDHIDSLNGLELYEGMVQLAWELRSDVGNPVGVDAAAAAESVLLDLPVPGESERGIHVRPETLAGVMAFLQSPHAEEGTYVIVDVGAGTTEVSMFLHGKDRSQPGQPFYSNYLNDGTFPVGGGDVNRELAKFWDVDIETARRRKESGHSIPDGIEAPVRIFRGYRSVCTMVRAENRLPPSQCEYDLFAFGGGSRLDAVRRALGSDLHYPPLKVRRFERIRPPKNLVRFDGLEKNFDLFALACGLASTVFWDFRTPRETGPMAPPAPHQPRPDRDELYPK